MEELFEEPGSIRRKRKKGHPLISALVVFLGGITIGVCIMLVWTRLQKDDYDAALIADTVSQIVSGQKQLTQEEMEELRRNPAFSTEEVEKLLSSYDEDAERAIRIEEEAMEEAAASGQQAETGDATQIINWNEPIEDVPEPFDEYTESEEETAGIHDDVSDDVSDDESEKSARALIEGLKQALINGEGTMNALRGVFVDQIMVASGGNFYFFPISDKLAHHDYDEQRLRVNDDGTLDYVLDDDKKAKKGIDVSRYQGDIDWEKVAASGIDFAFLRAGFRGYGSGELQADETFLTNAMAASQQGIEIGVYFFTQAINEDEAREEARMVIDALGGNQVAYPVVLDVEKVKGGRMNALDQEQLTDVCLAFCDEVSTAGYEPMIYGNLETFMMMLDLERLEGIRKWLAYYNNDIYFPYEFDIWQYSSSGKVDGIEGKVDMNIQMK